MPLDFLPLPAFLLGAGLVVLALLDIFLTVLHIEAESPFSNHLNRAVWRVMLTVVHLLPMSRAAGSHILAWGAPMMIVGDIAFWALAYVLGFALIYWPLVHDPAFFSVNPEAGASSLGDALYFSGVSFFTLGYGDVAPLHPLTRFLAVAEGALGLLTISLTVAYVLSVYPMITRQIALAVSLNQEMAGRADGMVMALRYVASGRSDVLVEWLREVNRELLHLAHAHGFYPVLYYVRPTNVHGSFARILVLIQAITITLRYGLDPAAHRSIVTDPRLGILEEGLLYTLHSLGASIHLAETSEETRQASATKLYEDFVALRDLLDRPGLTVVSLDDGAARTGYTRFRGATDPYIEAYARNIGYESEALRATYGRWERGGALETPSEVEASLS